MTTQETTDFAPLADRYEVIGELGGRRDMRTFIARPLGGGDDVLVSVVRPLDGDEGNALSHLATDARRLSGRSHPNLVPVLEAHWLPDDSLAIVTARLTFPTLEDLLVRRDEAFAPPRVATILREINAALEWARSEQIVHRAVDPASIHVEPGSDRVLLSFVPRALRRAEMPGAAEDARTIATLARAMLTRSVADPERDHLPLGELRPGLPDRLIEQTNQLLALTPGSPVPDVSEYIGVVAMADTLKRIEQELVATTQKLLEEERIAREKLEAERLAAEKAYAEQARLFQLERDEFAKERERILAELDKQRGVLERERALLAREREEHERDRQLLRREREEHRRWADEVEKAFAAQAAAFEQQARALRESEQARVEAQAQVRDAALRDEAMRDAAMRDTEVLPVATPATPVQMPPRPKQYRVRPGWVRSLAHRAAIAWERRPAWNRRHAVSLAVVLLLLVMATTAVAIARRRMDRPEETIRTATNPRTVVDSAAGRVSGQPASGGRSEGEGPSQGIPADFSSSVARSNEAGVPRDLIAGVRSLSEQRDAAETQPFEATPFPRRRVDAPVSRPRPVSERPTDSATAVPRPADTAIFGPPPATAPAPSQRPDSTRLPRRDTARARPDTSSTR